MQHYENPQYNSSDNSLPYAPTDSPGSSVSTRLKDEYDELLKYAVVVPTYDKSAMAQTITDYRNSFSRANPHLAAEQQQQQQQQQHAEEYVQEEDSGTEIEDVLSQPGDRADGAPRNVPGACQDTSRSTKRHPCQPPSSYIEPGEAGGEPRRMFEPCAESVDTESHVTSPGGGELKDGYSFSMTVDKDVAHMEGLMATWLGDLNRNVLAEFGQSKIRMLAHYKHLLQKENERHAAEMNRQQNETECLKELVLTYEQSIERKDGVISNLTRAMQKQSDKFDMAKTFCEWKIRHNDKKREAFASNLAERHYHRGLSQKVWAAWHGLVEARWRQRVERACQTKAQEVCMTLTNDYETRVASLNEALESTQKEVTRLHAERDRYEETMKKAFMRGVCALNLEAMTMFNGDEDGDCEHPAGPEGGRSQGDDGFMPSVQEYMSEPHGAPAPRVITSTGASISRSTTCQTSASRPIPPMCSRTKAGQKGRVISAKVSARLDGNARLGAGTSGLSVGLAPPMSSVVVERHQPVSKATIGKATASQFPLTGPGATSIIQRRLAGQLKQTPLATPNIQTIKMVE